MNIDKILGLGEQMCILKYSPSVLLPFILKHLVNIYYMLGNQFDLDLVYLPSHFSLQLEQESTEPRFIYIYLSIPCAWYIIGS